MQLSDIIYEINKDIDEELDFDELIGWINRCIDDLSPIANYQKMIPLTVTPGVDTYDMPTDLTKRIQIVDGTRVLPHQDLSNFTDEGYKIYANKIIIQPMPTETKTLTLYYDASLPYLKNMTDIPVIHQNFHDLFILYGVARFMYKDDETYRKGDAMSEYNSRKRDFERFMNKADIAPIVDVYNMRWS